MARITFLFLLLVSVATQAQEFGLSFSYFLPRNGYFSTPISPFSVRGIGVSLNKFTTIETGASLYRMSGLNVIDMPFETKDPVTGPNFTLLVPLEVVFTLSGRKASLDFKGGAFGFVPMDNRIDYGNLDRAIRLHENWQVANADVTDYRGTTGGYGWMVGTELSVPVRRQYSVSLEVNYLAGTAAFPFSGTYTGGNGTVTSQAFDYGDARLDLTGLEVSIGASMSAGNGGRPKSKRRR